MKLARPNLRTNGQPQLFPEASCYLTVCFAYLLTVTGNYPEEQLLQE